MDRKKDYFILRRLKTASLRAGMKAALVFRPWGPRALAGVGSIWIIILIATAVRLWGINFGLPHTECRPDESIITDIVYSALHSFHPGTFNYPSFYKYLALCFYILYFFFGIITGKYQSMSGFFTEYELYPANFFLINRLLSASLGIATVFIVYKIAKYLFGRRTAVISALFLSLAHLHVRDSHFGAADIPLTFFVMCSMWFIVRSIDRNTLKDYLMAGLCAGLAASTKYQGVLLVVPMIIAHWLSLAEDKNKITGKSINHKIMLFMFALTVSFLLTTPYALLDFRHFISDVVFEFRHLGYGHGIILGRGWWYHVRFSLFYGLGGSLLLVSLSGIIILARINAKKAIMLCSFPFIYYVVIARGNTVFLRYAIPLVPFLCITAAVFTEYAGTKLASGRKPYLGNIVTYSLAIVILLPSAYNAFFSNRLLANKDNRVQVAEWISQNIARGSSIYQALLFPPGRVQLYPLSDSLPTVHYNAITKIRYRIPEPVRMNMKFYLENKNIIGYENWEYSAKIKGFIYKEEIQRGLPEYIIVGESPLSVYSKLAKDAQEIIKNSYRLKEAFKAVNMSEKRNWFDQQDAFFLPFAGFRGIKRPGPNLYIYERNDLAQSNY